jgi:hypothetical protein
VREGYERKQGQRARERDAWASATGADPRTKAKKRSEKVAGRPLRWTCGGRKGGRREGGEGGGRKGGRREGGRKGEEGGTEIGR